MLSNHPWLQAFTKTFKDCNPVSSLKLACLSTMEEMLVPVSFLYLLLESPSLFSVLQMEFLMHQKNKFRLSFFSLSPLFFSKTDFEIFFFL